LGNLDKALGFFEEMNKYFKELYADYPNNVDFKNGLAISYSKLGAFSRDKLKDNKQAKTYFQSAEKLWRELVRDAPQYVQFQQFLGIVQKDIQALN
jgi:tetratricopeptide (TPR) repeat protein